jgi:Ca2+-binding EF-hand superfamily protein
LGGGKVMGNEKIWDDVIREVDVNGDGGISYEEFKELMRKLILIEDK